MKQTEKILATIGVAVLLLGCNDKAVGEDRQSLPYEATTVEECLEQKACSEFVFRKTGGEFLKQPNFSSQVPEIFPVAGLIYSHAEPLGCSVNIFKIEDSFRKDFSEELLINIKLLEDSERKNETAIYPWQRTPIRQNISYMSKAALVLDKATECIKDGHFENLFLKNASSKEAYFSVNPSNRIYLYVADENVLFHIEYD